MIRLLEGHVIEKLRELPDNSVHVCVTSPPYFGLRNYSTEPQVWGGDSGHEHEWHESRPWAWCAGGGNYGKSSLSESAQKRREEYPLDQRKGGFCECGAWLGEHGSEPTPELFIEHEVLIFREVRRVLHPTGVLFVNIGDSYAGSGKGPTGHNGIGDQGERQGFVGTTRGPNSQMANRSVADRQSRSGYRGSKREDRPRGGLQGGTKTVDVSLGGQSAPDCKPLDMIGVPWMLAFALRADGWYLRMDNIWEKPNPMPESVNGWRWERHQVKQGRNYVDCSGCDKCQDNDLLVLRKGSGRTTKAHEYIFQFTKTDSYYYDVEAVREPQSEGTHARFGENGRHAPSVPKAAESGTGIKSNKSFYAATMDAILPNGRNKRSVWTIATAPFSEAHFATFPPKLPEDCIKAGSSEKGCCPECLMPWARVVTKGELVPDAPGYTERGRKSHFDPFINAGSGKPNHHYEYGTLDWRPTCSHGLEPVPCTVLDIFAGSGTTLMVADRLHRNAIGIELNSSYAEILRRRVTGDCPLYTELI